MAVWYQADAGSKKIYTDPEKSTSDESLSHAINTIHALGMKVMLKPHVDLADGEMRTNIIPSEEWFASYKEFILHFAPACGKEQRGASLYRNRTVEHNDLTMAGSVAGHNRRYQGSL